MEAWAIALIVLGAIIILLFIFAIITYHAAFGKRYEKNPLLKYFTADDFNLACEEVSIGKLGGFIYRNDNVADEKRVVIFVHGMGPGHMAYTTEIAYFCNLGYTVLALDSLGCNLSKGKNIRGMYEGVKTAKTAIDFARTKFKESKLYLIGHSWGGYSVLCASAERKVDKVVAISAPSSPVKTLYEGAAKFISKPFAAILCPFWFLINLFKYGANGNANAIKRARKNGTPTLLVHGDKDLIVTPFKAAYYGVYGENVTKFLSQNKAHNPYNTIQAEAKLAELSSSLSNARKMTEEERESYFSTFDYKAATEEDAEVMRYIADFLERQ